EEWAASAHARQTQIVLPARSPAGAISLCASRLESPIHAAVPSNGQKVPAVPQAPSRTAVDLPLAGVRVVDFCIILAGPTCGRTLGELGADVIKIDGPRRTMNNPHGWLDINSGKRTILLDIKKPEGREAALQLFATMDIILENLREGKLAK